MTSPCPGHNCPVMLLLPKNWGTGKLPLPSTGAASQELGNWETTSIGVASMIWVQRTFWWEPHSYQAASHEGKPQVQEDNRPLIFRFHRLRKFHDSPNLALVLVLVPGVIHLSWIPWTKTYIWPGLGYHPSVTGITANTSHIQVLATY